MDAPNLARINAQRFMTVHYLGGSSVTSSLISSPLRLTTTATLSPRVVFPQRAVEILEIADLAFAEPHDHVARFQPAPLGRAAFVTPLIA